MTTNYEQVEFPARLGFACFDIKVNIARVDGSLSYPDCDITVNDLVKNEFVDHFDADNEYQLMCKIIDQLLLGNITAASVTICEFMLKETCPTVVETDQCAGGDCDGCPDTITVEVKFACGHEGTVTTTIDNAGPDVSMALDEMCPACDQLAEEDTDPCFHCHNLGTDTVDDCAGCSYHQEFPPGPPYARVCQVCGELTNEESCCTQVTGFVTTEEYSNPGCSGCTNVDSCDCPF
jgi:hypothetical protein